MHISGVYLTIAYFSFFVAAMVFAVLINALLLKFSRTLGTRQNNENLIRWSTQAKPAMGGISFYISFLLSLAAISFFFQPNDYFLNIKFLGIVIACTIGFLMGLFDDAYNTKVFVKLFAQITCGVILIATGTYIHITGSIYADYLITLVWVVGMMNSVNMLDNMDGITTIVSLAITLTVFINSFLTGMVYEPANIILLGLIASLIGFLFFNWHPSKMYMGDTGSQFLGIILAVIGITFFWNFSEPSGYDIPSKQILLIALVFALPIIDTLTVFIKRLRQGKSPFVGGRDHTTHHLSYIGLKDNQVALLFMGISIVNMTIASFIIHIIPWNHWFTVILSLFWFAQFTVLFVIANRNKK